MKRIVAFIVLVVLLAIPFIANIWRKDVASQDVQPVEPQVAKEEPQADESVAVVEPTPESVTPTADEEPTPEPPAEPQEVKEEPQDEEPVVVVAPTPEPVTPTADEEPTPEPPAEPQEVKEEPQDEEPVVVVEPTPEPVTPTADEEPTPEPPAEPQEVKEEPQADEPIVVVAPTPEPVTPTADEEPTPEPPAEPQEVKEEPQDEDPVVVVAPAPEPVTPTAEEEPTPEPQSVEEERAQLHRLFADVTNEFRHAVEQMEAVQTPDDTRAAAAACEKAFAAFGEFYELFVKLEDDDALTQQEMDEWESVISRLAAGWGSIYQKLGVQTLECSELVYQLFIRRTPFVEDILQKNWYMETWLCMNPLDESKQSPGLSEEQAAWRESMAEQHAEYMDAHRDVFSGGSGASSEEAIIIAPGMSDDEQTSAIAAYMQAVCSDADSCYVSMQVSPDGTFHVIYSLYKGVYQDSEGKTHLRVLPIWFRTKTLLHER